MNADRIIDKARREGLMPKPAGGWVTDGAGRAIAPDYYDPPATPKPKTTPTGSGGSGGSITAQQRRAAKNQIGVSKYNARSVKDELKAANRNFAQGDKQNRARAKVNMRNNSRTASGDRFAQLQKMQSATSGLMASAGNALQGGQAMNVANMLKQRNGMDNNETLRTLATNQNATIDALNESLNASALGRNSAAAAAARALRGLEADLAAQLNNINPKLYKAPGKGSTNLGSKKVSNRKAYTPKLTSSVGYFTTAPATMSAPAPQNTGSSYFDQLMRGGY